MGLLRPITRFFTMLWGFFNKLLCFLHIKRNRKYSGSILPLHNEPVFRAVSNDVQLPVPTNDVRFISVAVRHCIINVITNIEIITGGIGIMGGLGTRK